MNEAQNKRDAQLEAFGRLLDIMDDLRAECPWDKKQTIHSLRPLTIEEMYELTDAIGDDDWMEIKKELGDVMLHLVFYAKIASEKSEFDIADVLNAQCEKLIFRHPHIYGDVKVEGEEEVKRNWEQLKLKEGNKSVLGGVPKNLPSLVKAHRMQEKAGKSGFDWPSLEEVWAKFDEEILELKEARTQNLGKAEIENEFGDVLFSLINVGRHLGIEPENALDGANRKFIRRFQHIEARLKEIGKSLAESNLAEMDSFWNEAKAQEKSRP